MIQHDPLRHIIANIGLVESGHAVDTGLINLCSSKVIELKNLYYHNQHEDVDYNDAEYQVAYMIYYFPIYVENIYRALTAVDLSSINGSFQKGMKVCIYGGGPIPELYGFLAYLNEYFPGIDYFESHFFDKNNWEMWRKFCLQNHFSEYWGPSKRMVYSEYMCDLCEFYNRQEIENYPIIKNADLHIIQNCGLDIITSLREVDKYRQVFCNLTRAMKKGSMIIIIDVPVYNAVIGGTVFDIRSNLQWIRSKAVANQHFTLLRNVSDGAPYQYNPNVVMHPIIRDNFPIKSTVKYHALIMRKDN